MSELWQVLIASLHESAVHEYVSAQVRATPTHEADPLHASETVQ